MSETFGIGWGLVGSLLGFRPTVVYRGDQGVWIDLQLTVNTWWNQKQETTVVACATLFGGGGSHFGCQNYWIFVQVCLDSHYNRAACARREPTQNKYNKALTTPDMGTSKHSDKCWTHTNIYKK